MSVTIKNVPPFALAMFDETSPDGVAVVPQRIIENRGLNVDINIDVQLLVDVAKVSGVAFAAWLTNRLRRFPDAKLAVDGH